MFTSSFPFSFVEFRPDCRPLPFTLGVSHPAVCLPTFSTFVTTRVAPFPRNVSPFSFVVVSSFSSMSQRRHCLLRQPMTIELWHLHPAIASAASTCGQHLRRLDVTDIRPLSCSFSSEWPTQKDLSTRRVQLSRSRVTHTHASARLHTGIDRSTLSRPRQFSPKWIEKKKNKSTESVFTCCPRPSLAAPFRWLCRRCCRWPFSLNYLCR